MYGAICYRVHILSVFETYVLFDAQGVLLSHRAVVATVAAHGGVLKPVAPKVPNITRT